MDPTRKKHPKSSTTATTTCHPRSHHPTPPDPTIPPSSPNKITLKSSKIRTTSKSTDLPPPRIDAHLQAKAMTVSLNGDSSISSLLRKTHQQRSNKLSLIKSVDIEMEKRRTENEKIKSHEKEESKRPSVSSRSGQRRSFCNSQTELGDIFSSIGAKIVAVDMPPFMQIHAVNCARKAYDSLDKFSSKTLAFTLKKEFDGVYGPAWHCIVGTSFGSFVTHSVGGFMYFSMDHKLYILLFKTTVQRAG
ncbi:hypothetical protein HHK36_007168 [Tetracentron sinense]|uniref:Dynein light chain n=1 Tax=Tetracentron sinense TaxID=13715 RepID=A0A835DLD0_TETSI|nr:hypothetical protein HHK36_007168 [Tetracentron sinense]